ncbi:MAG: ABC transporter ATP-binding protein [Bacteroidota bacterium]|nr:ABC transporter ATP-binding protein [Bacteroidota bacterium]
MITTSTLKFSYPNHQFVFPEIVCENGESLLITGESGSGKTTLLHLLGGILRPDLGDININNTDITKLTNSQLDRFRGQNIGIILQKSHFISSISVLDNILFSSWLSSKDTKRKQAIELLEMLGLEQHINKKTSQLSIGQQQRASIARALIHNPKLILADEPTSSLDDTNAKIVANLLKDISQKYDTSLVIVTHDQRLKEQFPTTIDIKNNIV